MGRDHAERSMDAVAPALPDDLLDVLARHGVAATVDGVWDELERRGLRMLVDGPIHGVMHDNQWEVMSPGKIKEDLFTLRGIGPTRLIALARAFAALVETEEGKE